MRHGRPKVQGSRRAITKPISLFPLQVKYANQRTLEANISFSRYVQTLIEFDREKNILGEAMTLNLKQAV